MTQTKKELIKNIKKYLKSNTQSIEKINEYIIILDNLNNDIGKSPATNIADGITFLYESGRAEIMELQQLLIKSLDKLSNRFTLNIQFDNFILYQLCKIYNITDYVYYPDTKLSSYVNKNDYNTILPCAYHSRLEPNDFLNFFKINDKIELNELRTLFKLTFNLIDLDSRHN